MSYKVTLQPDETSFEVLQNETVLDAALRQGVRLPYGCRDGACGACKSKVIDGTFSYIKQDLSGLSDKDKSNGFGLMCQAIANSDLNIEARLANTPNEIQIRKLPCRVMHIDKLTHDVVRLKLKLPKTERLAFLAGQYIDILMSDGKQRSFSLANAPHDDEFLELHIRYYEGGAFSEYAFNDLSEKTLLRLEGPHGSFYFREDSDRPVIMVAGGTGFAPVKSIIEHTLAAGIHRPIKFYWGVRAKSDLYLAELAESWTSQYDHIEYIPVLSEPIPEDNWQGRTGYVHEAVLEDFENFSAYEVYTCGPPPMTKAVCESVAAKGLEEKYIYSDSFEFAAAKE